MSDNERKLATIRNISAIDPIPDADAIEVATVDGWKVVVKKGEYKVDDLVVYVEIDSWIPTELAPFLSKGKEPREYNGVKGERLRTAKLRGQISQGLILPCEAVSTDWNVGDDVTDILNIQKYEAPIPACLAGTVKGNFPVFFPKTDQERIQNLAKKFDNLRGHDYEVTEKLDGSSCSFYFNNGEFGVCSRNLDLKEDYHNTFWKMAAQYDIETKLEKLGVNVVIQGEIIGEGIQKNPYKLTGQAFFVFDVYDIDNGEYYDSFERRAFISNLGLNHVPVIDKGYTFTESESVDSLLTFAEGKSILNGSTEREGIVFKSFQNPSLSFKAISNKFLLKNGD